MSGDLKITEFISIAQPFNGVVEGSQPAYGQGFNYRVEVSIECPEDLRGEKDLRKDLREVLNLIDHRHLGRDLNLGFPATSASLAEFLFKQLQMRWPGRLKKIHLIRGDGYQVCYR